MIQRVGVVLGMIMFCAGTLHASEPGSGRALWIEVKEKGVHKTTIAMTEGIARELLKHKDKKFHFSDKGKKDLITREMLKSVLDGREESVEVRDREEGSEAKIYMKELEIPDHTGGKDRLILETYKAGKKEFRISLPDIEVETSDEESDSDDLVKLSFGWKRFLPFLTEQGGALYINNEKDESEVWIYVD